MKTLLTMALAMTFFSTQAKAGLLIDPYIGIGQSKSTLDVINNDDDTSTGRYLGGRLGYSIFLFSAGVDYQIASGLEADGDDASARNISAFVGVDLPILARAWAEYFVSSSIDSDASNLDLSFKNGYGVGVGFTGLPFVSINLEIEALNFDAEIGNSRGDYTIAQTVLSVSLPLNL